MAKTVANSAAVLSESLQGSPSARSVSRCPGRPPKLIVMRGRHLIAELRRHQPPCGRTIRTVMISRGLIAERRRPRASAIWAVCVVIGRVGSIALEEVLSHASQIKTIGYPS